MIKLEELPDDGYSGHGGGDLGLMKMMDKVFREDSHESALIENSIESHLIGFAAEQSRLADGQPVLLDELR